MARQTTTQKRKRHSRKRYASQVTSGCVALGYSRPVLMILLMTLMLFLQFLLLFWSAIIFIRISRRGDSVLGVWSSLFSLHAVVQFFSIIAMACSHLMRLSVRFIQRPPDKFLCMMQFNDVALILLAALTLICNITLFFVQENLSSANVKLKSYILCSWLFIFYHIVINTLFSKFVFKFLKRQISRFVSTRIDLHRSIGDFDDVEATAKEIFHDICNASEISTILDALKLTRAFQRYRKLRCTYVKDIENDVCSNKLDMHSLQDLEFYARAVKYAIGIYGVYGTLTQNPRLYFRYFFGGQEHRRKQGFMKVCDVKEEDLILDYFQPSLFLPSYVIFSDHDNRQIWMALSGSSTMEDLLTDMHAHPTPVNVDGFNPMYAHSGIWKSSVNLHNKLRSSAQLRQFLEKHPDYELILTGHSLGAAVAAALVVLFRKEPLPFCEDRQTRVIGFGCPPVFSAVLDLPSVTQITIVDDFITQLNLRSIKWLVSEMSVLTNTVCSSPWLRRMPRRWSCNYEVKVQRKLFEFFDSLDIDAVEDKIDHHFRLICNDSKYIQLFVPGKRVSLRPLRQSIEEDDADRGLTEGILITPTMLSSHGYLNHQDALLQAIGRAKADLSLSSSSGSSCNLSSQEQKS